MRIWFSSDTESKERGPQGIAEVTYDDATWLRKEFPRKLHLLLFEHSENLYELFEHTEAFESQKKLRESIKTHYVYESVTYTQCISSTPQNLKIIKI